MIRPGPAPKVLVTRPSAKAAALAARLSAMGFAPVCAPMLEIRRLERLGAADVACLDQAQAAVFTSANAAEAAAEDLAALQWRGTMSAFAVGAATARAAARAGFDPVEAPSGGDARALLTRLLTLRASSGPLALLRGREVAFDLAPPLAGAGFETWSRRLYAADPVSTPPPIEAQDGLDAALFLSPRTAEIFTARARAETAFVDLSGAVVLCISAKTAAALAGAPVRRLVIAEKPDLDAALAALAYVFSE